ncbi:MAG TPA: glycoside hydrolase family 3 C-terminal domain-containing protein [Candidatus Lokiarchaeia archaeon]|nr:glycoside hydrolase family 3 C-terminal domain-containing protein [Candidatus Lokiarchaeia archaeon]
MIDETEVSAPDVEARVDDLLQQLTLDEKFLLLAGVTSWSTAPIERLGIKSYFMTDGPHGIGPHSSGGKECTYFPVGICRASTWNPDLSYEFGKALGEEVREIGYHMILGPGINILRTPMCGRNFEYQTEDPHLNARMIVPAVKGIQSNRIAACVKHYLCNNQEQWRNWVDVIVSQRALEEIYLPGFKAAAVEGGAWSFMASYNRIHGKWACEQEDFVRGTLLDKWGWTGFVVSDWGAMNFIETAANCIRAGVSLEMPSPNRYTPEWLQKDLDAGKFTEDQLNDDVRRLLRAFMRVGLLDDPATLPEGCRNTPEHQAVARKIAEEGIVLLKNAEGLLPIDISSIKRIAVIGPNADAKMGEAGGSSQVKSPHEVTLLAGIQQHCEGQVEIVDNPEEADITIAVCGLSHKDNGDSEGNDRVNFDLSKEQVDLVLQSVEKCPKTVLVLVNGTPVGLSDELVGSVPAILEAWYPGMEGGNAIASILFGDVNPSGKLPVTFPKRLEDVAAHASVETYPGVDDEETGPTVRYDEGIFVGYRHIDTQGIDPLFPFGHGLSYTTFDFANLALSLACMPMEVTLEVTFDITNTGNRAGAEVTQLYVQDVESSVPRPLKGFKKVFLEPGQQETIKMSLDWKDLAFFDEEKGDWNAEPGMFKILVGASSRDIRLSEHLELLSS